MTAHSQFFKPPQQSRSQETLDRILDAAEQVLAEKAFGEATLAEIMERAQAMAAGPALDAAQEQAAKARGWR